MRLPSKGALLVAAALAAGSASAQVGAPPHPSTAQPSGKPTEARQTTNQATKHIATVNTGLQSATVAASMLKQLSANPQTVDQAHAHALSTNIRQDLREADLHLRELAALPMPAHEKQTLQTLETQVQSAQQHAKLLPQEYTNPRQLNETASRLYDELRGTLSPLRDTAKAMNVKLDLTPIT